MLYNYMLLIGMSLTSILFREKASNRKTYTIKLHLYKVQKHETLKNDGYY